MIKQSFMAMAGLKRLHVLLAVFAAALLAFAPAAQARDIRIPKLEIKPLSPLRVEALSTDARDLYDRGMLQLDRINYPKALQDLRQASKVDAENVYLHFIVVEVAHYLGDTRSGSDAIRFYDIAEEHLRAMNESERLNEREKNRTQEAIDLITELRANVAERDEARRKVGKEMADALRKEIYRDLEDEEKDIRTQREEQLKERQRLDALQQAAQAAGATRGSRGGGGGMGGSMVGPGM